MAAAAATHHTHHTTADGTNFDALFRRVNHRLRDHRYTGLREIELLPHLTPPDILTTTRTWKDLCRFLRDKVAWLTPGVCVFTGDYSFAAGL
jgi:hypothetical protein